jgi:hypothetical protein
MPSGTRCWWCLRVASGRGSLAVKPLDEVKGAWADDLRGFTVEQIKYGLSMLGERPPNLIQFKDLCKKAPQYFDSLQLTYRPTPSPEKLAAFRKVMEDA